MSKKLLVTGSTRGIGKAIAEKFHSDGWDVAITARNKEEVDKIVDQFNRKRVNSAIGFSLDFSLVSDIVELRNFINQNWFELDCLVFNVGSGKGKKGLQSNVKENEELFKLNFIDVVKTQRILLNLIKPHKDSSIIFIGSIAQEVNVKAPITYACAKRALNNYVNYLSVTLAKQNINVNLINPGHILTQDGVWDQKKRSTNEEFLSFVRENIPVGEIGKDEYVADLTYACANNDFANYLTGAKINLDGGTSINF
jgi:short-subunit dehydrogenase